MALSFRFSSIHVKDADDSSEEIEEEDISVLSKLIGNQFRYSNPAKLEFRFGRNDTTSSEQITESDNEMEDDWVADFHSVLDIQKAPVETKELLNNGPKTELSKEKHVPENRTTGQSTASTVVKELSSAVIEIQENLEYEETFRYHKIDKQIQKCPSLRHDENVNSNSKTQSMLIAKENSKTEEPKESINLGQSEIMFQETPEQLNKAQLLMTKAERRASRINELKEKFEVLNKKLNLTYISKVHVSDEESTLNLSENPSEEKVRGPTPKTTPHINVKEERKSHVNSSSPIRKKAQEREIKPIKSHPAKTILEPICVETSSVHPTVSKRTSSCEEKIKEIHGEITAEKNPKKVKQVKNNLSVNVTNESCISSVIEAIVKDAKSPCEVMTPPDSVSETKKLNSFAAESVPLPSPKISAISESSALSNIEPGKQASPVSIKHKTKEKKKPKVYDIQPAYSFPLDDLLPAVKASPVKSVVETSENICYNQKHVTIKEPNQRSETVENVQTYPYIERMMFNFPDRYKDISTNMNSVPMDCDSEPDRYSHPVQTPYHEEVSFVHTNSSAPLNFWPQPSMQSYTNSSNQYHSLSQPAFNPEQGPMMDQNNSWTPNYHSNNPFQQNIHTLPYISQPSPLQQQNITYGTTLQQMPKDNKQPTDPLSSVLLAMKYGNDVAIQKLQAALCEQIRSRNSTNGSDNPSNVDNSYGFYKERSSNQQTSNETLNSGEQSGSLFQLFVEQVSGLVKTDDDRSKVRSLLEVLKKEGCDRLKGTGFTPPQAERTYVTSCEDICEPSGEDNKSDSIELFEGRTLLKGGVKARHIPKTTVYRTDKTNPKDPRPLPGKHNAVTTIKLPAFYETAWQTKPVELRKETSIPFNVKDPRCRKLLSEDPQKLDLKADKRRTPDSQQSNNNASDTEALEKVLENLRQLEKKLKERSKSDDKSDNEENKDKTPVSSKSTSVTPGLEKIATKLMSPPKPITVITGLSQVSTTSEESSQESSIPVEINKSTSEPVWIPNQDEKNQRGSFLQNVKMVESVETDDVKPLERERKPLPFETKKQTKPSIGIVKPVQQVRNDSNLERPSVNTNIRDKNTKSKPASSKDSAKGASAKSSEDGKRIDKRAIRSDYTSKGLDISYSDISDEEQSVDSTKVLTIGSLLRQRSNHSKTITGRKPTRTSPGNDNRHNAHSYEQRHKVKPRLPEKYDKKRRSRSGSSERHKLQKRSHSRSPGLEDARQRISNLPSRHYQGSSSRQPSPAYVTKAWHKELKDESSQARQQGSRKRPSHSPQERGVEQLRKRHGSLERSEQSEMARERELEELEGYRDYLLQKTLDMDPDEDHKLQKYSSSKEYSRNGEEYRSSKEISRHNKKKSASKAYTKHSDECITGKKVSTPSEEQHTSKEHSRHSEDWSVYKSNQMYEDKKHRPSEERSKQEIPRKQGKPFVESQCSDSSRKRQHVAKGDSLSKKEKMARIDKSVTQSMKGDLRNKIMKHPDKKSRGPNYSSTVSEYFSSSFNKLMPHSNAGEKVYKENEMKDLDLNEDANLSDDDFRKEYMEIFTKPKTHKEPGLLKGTSDCSGAKFKTGLSKEKTAKQLKQEEEDRLFLEACKKKIKKYDEISPETTGIPKRLADDATPVKIQSSSMSAKGTLDY